MPYCSRGKIDTALLLLWSRQLIIYEEHFITSLLFRGLAHVRLTDSTFTLSLVLMRWVVIRIPLASIIEVHFYHDLLGREVTVSYYNENGLFKGVRFSTRYEEQWQQAFRYVGIHIAGST